MVRTHRGLTAFRICVLTAMLMGLSAGNIYAAPLLQLNSHGHDVAIVQQNLVRLQYKFEVQQGVFDQNTELAVKNFQRDHNLPITGKVDRDTWWQLKGEFHPATVPAKAESVLPVIDAGIPQRDGNIHHELKEAVPPPPKRIIKPVPKVTKHTPTIKPNPVLVRPRQRKPKVRPTATELSRIQWKNLSSVPMGTSFLNRKEVNKLIATAKTYMGVPYLFGGNTPSGFDCSGYLEYVFAQQHIKIPRTADVQYNLGRSVKRSQLVRGDLVFFTTYEPGASHCGIYLGDGKFIHASTSKGIIVDDMNNDYWAPRYYGGRKIVK